MSNSNVCKNKLQRIKRWLLFFIGSGRLKGYDLYKQSMIRNGTHIDIEMLESKDKSEPLLLNGGVTSLMFINFREK